MTIYGHVVPVYGRIMGTNKGTREVKNLDVGTTDKKCGDLILQYQISKWDLKVIQCIIFALPLAINTRPF